MTTLCAECGAVMGGELLIRRDGDPICVECYRSMTRSDDEVFRLREHLTKIANFAIRHEGCGCFYEMAMDALAKPPSVEGE